MKNIDSAFKYVRLFTGVLIVCCTGLCVFVLYQGYALAAATQSKIYILVNGKALEAFAAERKDNIPVEAKDHIGIFHHYFFTLDPDEKAIQATMTRALYLADASAKRQYENLRENGYYNNIIAGNISQEIQVDSIALDTDTYPYYFRCRAVQKIIRATSIVSRSLVTEGYLRNVSRSSNNTHGFLIERWKTLENQDIKTENR